MDEYGQINGVCAAVSIDQRDRQWPLLSNVLMNCKAEKGWAESLANNAGGVVMTKLSSCLLKVRGHFA